MRYISTRGDAAPTSFSQALLEGLAPDGGLYLPQTWPAFTPDELGRLAGQPYAAVAAEVLSRFTGEDFDRATLDEICSDAYATFAHPAVVPLRQLDAGVFLLELHHGPTLAFKDVAMQLLSRLYDHVLQSSGRVLTIVCATSGDTGGAAVEAFRGARHARLVVLFPEGRISDVQRRFMTTTRDDNVRTVALDGDFDDCQAIVKALFADDGFRAEVDLSGVNSINWGRVAAQAVYYITSALALGAATPQRRVTFVVPTGNFGDAFAGYVAQRMGLPIERIVVATNANDILARALQSGRYERGGVVATQSPAMDIQVASNFERLYFEAVRRDGVETARAFRAFAKLGAIELPPQALAFMQDLFTGVSVSEDETARTIVSTLNESGALIDPHTAVALAAARQANGLQATGETSSHDIAGGSTAAAPLRVVLSTAHPAKFPEAVKAATGDSPALHVRSEGLSGRPERIDRLPADAAAVKAYVRAFAQAGSATLRPRL